MARKLIQTYTEGVVSVKVYRDTEWNEYRYTVTINGKTDEAMTGFTDDKQDAMASAQRTLRDTVERMKATTNGATVIDGDSGATGNYL